MSVSVKVIGVFRAATDTRDVPDGTVIFEEGSSGEEMFGVIEGTVELRLSNGRVITLGPDDTFGEMALVDSSARSATAVAVGECKLAVIDRNRFLWLVGETPRFALHVMASLADRLREAQSQIAEG